MVAHTKTEDRRTKNELRRGASRSSFLVFLSSLFTLLLIAGCPGEDLTPPEVTIIVPADGDSVAGTTTIRARATDNTAVARVEFIVDAVRVGLDTIPAGPIFEVDWNPVGLLPGTTHALRCVATDDAGNRNSSPVVTVRISAAAGTHHAGTISTNETWTVAGSPHIIDADLDVEAYLTIQPGVIVLIADGASIAVGTRAPAGLRAQGRTDSTITFTALNPSSGPGAWGGIHYLANATPDSNTLRHCTIEYAGRNAGALVRCEAGRVDIDSCELRSSSERGVSASGTGLGSLSRTGVSECAGYPVSLAPGLVSALGVGNTLTANGRDAIELTGGTVAATDTWPNLGVPYCITASVTVADTSNPLLTIAPGCSLLFGDSAALRVGFGQPGGLRAEGTYGRIVFAPLAASPGPGNWYGLELWEKTDPARTILNYCRISGAGAGNNPAIYINQAPVTITNTRIADCSGDGIICYNTGFARFENDTITACAGYPLHIAAQHVSTIGNGNSFSGNLNHDGIEVIGGTITRDAQYRRQDVPYLITGTVEVGSSYEPSLVIDPGVELRFDPGTALAIGRNARASLQAIGYPDSITFTAPLAQPGAWDGLRLERYASSASRLERCRLLYGGNQGILYVNSCVPTITNNEIAFSSNWCIYLADSDTMLNPDTLRRYNWLHDSDSVDIREP